MKFQRRCTFGKAFFAFLQWIAFFNLLFALDYPAFADVRLPSVFSDNMVLQKNRLLYFWGLSDPEEIVTVIIDNKRYATTADDKGAWWVKVPPQNTTQPFSIIVKGKNRITINNVITGDVWLCSGQSNMNMPLDEAEHASEDIDQAQLPDIRFFKEEPDCAGDPEFEGNGKWVICTPETAKDFSAIAFFFGREIQQKTKGTIALIQATRPGSSLITWLSREAIEKTPYKTLLGENEENFNQYKTLLSQIKQSEEAGEEQELLRLRKQVKVFKKKVNTATCAYNALIAPLAPYQLKGVLLYQGESDTAQNLMFSKLSVALLQDWREQFKFRALPFYFVQLPPVGAKNQEPQDSYYAELREVQARAQNSPYTFMAVTIDTGHGKDIPKRPREKKTIALRLANLALATQYGQPIKWLGPAYDHMSIEGKAIRIFFRRAEPELVSKDGPPQGFEIAGVDKIFHWADARIDGDSIIVSCKQVDEPIAVRYAWADNPKCNIFSADEIPLAPFRTDDWMHRKPEPASGKAAGTSKSSQPASGASASQSTK